MFAEKPRDASARITPVVSEFGLFIREELIPVVTQRKQISRFTVDYRHCSKADQPTTLLETFVKPVESLVRIEICPAPISRWAGAGYVAN